MNRTFYKQKEIILFVPRSLSMNYMSEEFLILEEVLQAETSIISGVPPSSCCNVVHQVRLRISKHIFQESFRRLNKFT